MCVDKEETRTTWKKTQSDARENMQPPQLPCMLETLICFAGNRGGSTM